MRQVFLGFGRCVVNFCCELKVNHNHAVGTRIKLKLNKRKECQRGSRLKVIQVVCYIEIYAHTFS